MRLPLHLLLNLGAPTVWLLLLLLVTQCGGKVAIIIIVTATLVIVTPFGLWRDFIHLFMLCELESSRAKLKCHYRIS